MYFAWIHHYCNWLFLPGIIGFILFIVIAASADRDDTSSEWSAGEVCILIFTLLIAIMSTLFDQIWVRQEKRYAWEWGMFNIVTKEAQRPEFKGVLKKDQVTGKIKKIDDTTVWGRRRTRCLSSGIILFFVLLVIAIVFGIFFYRAMLHNVWGDRLCAFINAVQIKMMNQIYKIVATKLTDWENHEIDSSYNQALAIKLFLFQFVNSYNSLFYIAFLKGTLEGCNNADCMGELETQLAVIFVTNMCMNFVELGMPFGYYKFRMWMEERNL